MSDSSNQGESRAMFEKSTCSWTLHEFTKSSNPHKMGKFGMSNHFGKGLIQEGPVFPETNGLCERRRWKLQIFINRENCGNEVILLYVKSCSKSVKDIFAKFSVSFLNSDDELITKTESEKHFFRDCDLWSNESSISRKDLISAISEDDILKIKVTVLTRLQGVQEEDLYCVPNRALSKLTTELGALLASGEFSDFRLKFNNGCEILVHRAVLAGRPFFSSIFKQAAENKLGYVEITDIDKDTMFRLLYFIYTGETGDLTEIEAGKLLAAAEICQEVDAKKSYANILKDNINVRNVLDILLLAETYEVPELKEDAFNYVLENFWKFRDLKKVEKLDSHPQLLKELVIKLFDVLNTSESVEPTPTGTALKTKH